jgi:hypothetical protein
VESTKAEIEVIRQNSIDGIEFRKHYFKHRILYPFTPRIEHDI